MLKSLIAPLRAHDITVVVFSIFLSLINLAFHDSIPEWPLLILWNVLLASLIIFLAHRASHSANGLLKLIHAWHPLIVILLTYKQLYFMVGPIHGQDYDELLIAIDRWLFGGDPTVWIFRFANPVITEILQVAYASFYFLFIIIGAELQRNKSERELGYYAFLIVYGFFLSYVGYFFLPAVGPRFILHNYHFIDLELPGIFLTNFLRDFIDAGGLIQKDLPNPAAFAQRDVFPSGHTMMTLMMIHFVWASRLRTRWFLTIIGTLLIVATVYLRYHYVIDLMAGAAFALICVWTAPKVFRWWEKKRELSFTPL